jgi:hypothetical protein
LGKPSPVRDNPRITQIQARPLKTPMNADEDADARRWELAFHLRSSAFHRRSSAVAFLSAFIGVPSALIGGCLLICVHRRSIGVDRRLAFTRIRVHRRSYPPAMESA